MKPIVAILFLILLLVNKACSSYEVDYPESDRILVLNALFKPGEKLSLDISKTGPYIEVLDESYVEYSVLYKDGIAVDTFKLISNTIIERKRNYNIAVKFKDGAVLEGSCVTPDSIYLKKVKVVELDPPIIVDANTLNYEYRIYIDLNQTEQSAENAYFVFRPIQVDTNYNIDSTSYHLLYSSWQVNDVFNLMNNKNYFSLPHNFKDTLIFRSHSKGLIRLAQISPVLYKALQNSVSPRDLEGQIIPESIGNVDGGTGIVSVFDTQEAR